MSEPCLTGPVPIPVRATLLLSLCLASNVPGHINAEQRASHEVDLGDGVSMVFMPIPAGTFTMGSTDAELETVAPDWHRQKREGHFQEERPARVVTLAGAFWMGKQEVTVGQFRRFVEASGHRTEAEEGSAFAGAFIYEGAEVRQARDANWRRPHFEQTDEHPVVCLSWNDAQAFAGWLNALDDTRPPGTAYRLPTEAEWEYACRAGSTTVYHFGDNAGDLAPFAWWSENSGGSTQPVGRKLPNAFGLHDMHGNVREWCLDWHGPYPDADRTDPTGPEAGRTRVVRGGSWYGDSRAVRSAHRSSQRPAWRNNLTGFRLVLAAAPPPTHDHSAPPESRAGDKIAP